MWPVTALLLASGCQWFVNDADKQVYNLIEKRQLDALGEARPAPIDQERVPIKVGHEAYQFVPHPVEPGVPADFETTTAPATAPAEADAGENAVKAGAAPALQQPQPSNGLNHLGLAPPNGNNNQEQLTATRPTQAEAPATTQPVATTRPAHELTLSESLAYAFAHSREFQTAKEDLYLSALALTLERHLWSPRFFGDIEQQYANYGEVRNFDHAMATVAEVGVRQKLPLGGEVTARVVDNLMRDLTHHITTAETGKAILEANIPLLRGAGLVAYESRFQAERNLIYAVRNFETFRRALTVNIAGDFFNLQQLKQQTLNERESVKVFAYEVDKARGLSRAGWIIQLEAQRAEQQQQIAINSEIDAIETYQTALDQFKIRLGMPMETEIDVILPAAVVTSMPAEAPAGLTSPTSLEESLQMPAVSEEEAIRVATKYRLDLINSCDRIDDAERGVTVAENGLLPDLSAVGSLTYYTDPTHLNSWEYSSDRQTARGAINLTLPLDRVAERNALRNSLIEKRRAERDYQLARDTVILQVRRAMRRVLQEQESLQIQILNRDLALERRRAARYRFQLGQVSNREIVDAENALLDARNRLAQAQANVRLAILQFRRDTGTLRVDDEGKWSTAVVEKAPNG